MTLHGRGRKCACIRPLGHVIDRKRVAQHVLCKANRRATRGSSLEADDMTKIDSIAGDQEVIVMLRLKFKPGTIDHVLSELVPIAMLTREEAGNIEFHIYRAQNDADRIVLFE